MNTIAQRIAEQLAVKPQQVEAAIDLLDSGATVPFIARYRKEVTAGLDDVQLRTLEEQLRYLRELEERREVILNSIREQDKLTPELEQTLRAAETKTRLEDLYLPYKPKRRTKAQIAREAGLAPLAEQLFKDPNTDPEILAREYVEAEKGIETEKQALDGARQILMEQFAEDAELLGTLREFVWDAAIVTSKVVEEKKEKATKFSDYFDYQEQLKNIPSHRALALFRGRNEGSLQLKLDIADTQENPDPTLLHPCEQRIAAHFNLAQQGRPADNWLMDTVRWTWKFKTRLHLDAELLMRLREIAEGEAIRVFSSNLKDLLLAAPAGSKVTIGLDPGLRTGVKVAVVDITGKLLETTTIYPHPPKNQWQESIQTLVALASQHQANLISIGNGTGSRETDKLVSELIKTQPDLKLSKLVVSEAGASVYSASELASQELNEIDVSLRGAVSIARRLQDPLAELVKIEPKSIGVGQYQHDVNQTQLARSLDAVVEDCVNAVGVDVNTASVSLLGKVSGLNSGLAKSIVAYRDENGAFSNREMLKQVPRLGEKTYEQAAGFLRISNGDNPLDASAVHPEAYPVVERILAQHSRDIKTVLGDSGFLRNLKPHDYTDDDFGVPTVSDILRELEKPGRDPRPEFKTATFKDNVNTLADLKPEMLLEGVVTNVTNFGAFVDVGVHQDGLVHISALSQSFVKDPRDIVKAGEVVKVKVLEVDLERKRVALTMCLQEKTPPPTAPARPARESQANTSAPRRDNEKRSPVKEQPPRPRKGSNKPTKKRHKSQQSTQSTGNNAGSGGFATAMAEAFARARKDD